MARITGPEYTRKVSGLSHDAKPDWSAVLVGYQLEPTMGRLGWPWQRSLRRKVRSCALRLNVNVDLIGRVIARVDLVREAGVCAAACNGQHATDDRCITRSRALSSLEALGAQAKRPGPTMRRRMSPPQHSVTTHRLAAGAEGAGGRAGARGVLEYSWGAEGAWRVALGRKRGTRVLMGCGRSWRAGLGRTLA